MDFAFSSVEKGLVASRSVGLVEEEEFFEALELGESMSNVMLDFMKKAVKQTV